MAVLKATKRTEIGTRAARKLRRRGIVPGIIYGHGETPEAITVSEHDIELAIGRGERLLELDLGGTKLNVLIKEAQYDTFGQTVTHVDLARVNLDERVEVTIPVTLVGDPEGLKDGGMLHQNVSEVRLEVPVAHIPDELKIVVSAMRMNDRKTLGDLKLTEGAKLLDDADAILCSVIEVAEEVAPEPVEGEEAAEPEVIGEKKEEDEGGEGE
jgi:large subunit ribosomal protein L25